MSKTDRRPAETRPDGRTQILNAAGEVFFREGFARSSIDLIAATAHMSKQSIYEHFANKMELFEAAVRRTLDTRGGALAEVVAHDDVERTLCDYGTAMFQSFAHPRGFGLFRANIVAANHFPELADELHEHRLASAGILGDYFAELVASRRFPAVDPMATAIRFGGGAVEGTRYFLGAPIPDDAAIERLAAESTHLFLHGYRELPANEGMAELEDILASVEEPVLGANVALRLSDDKLSRLIEAATDEFLENAYTGTSVQKIAAQVRSSKATVYRQFGNKEGLFRYLIEREIFLSSQADFTVPERPDAVQAVTDLARQVLDWHLTTANIRTHRLLIQEADFVPDLARKFYDVRAAVVARALDRLLQAHGLPRPATHAARAFYVHATFAVRFLTVRQFPEPAQRDAYSREAAILFLKGIGATAA